MALTLPGSPTRGPTHYGFEPTAASLPVEAVIIDRTDVPVYLRIAEKAMHLHVLGMSDRAIARALGVSDKTVTRATAAAGSDFASGTGDPEGLA